MYGTQTIKSTNLEMRLFENDVEMYGTQTLHRGILLGHLFENDVEMYGTQTSIVMFT